MATIAAAMDERIAAVNAGSTGVGGVLPWRAAGERGFGEGIETTTRQFPTWFVPRLRFFSGREDRLPIDGNLLVAMIAPRATLLEYGLNDEVSNSWGDEQAYYSALKVYKLLGQPEPPRHPARARLSRRQRSGSLPGLARHSIWPVHAGVDQPAYLPWDWDNWRANSKESVDLKRFPRASNDLLAAYSAPAGSAFAAANGAIASTADWERKAAEVRKSVEWMLGDEPPMMPPGAGRGGRGWQAGALREPLE